MRQGGRGSFENQGYGEIDRRMVEGIMVFIVGFA